MPPDTPLLAGRPTPTNHSPAPSYIPQLAITDRTMRTVRGDAARTPVIGLRPPAASVAAMIARSRASTSTAHWRK